ncbi:MAG: DUF4159 domain-containing protein [Planctomycetes bacterium]|nr:DUF4159 domain-containing protein [Planctomycetota bacterium]
MNSMRWVLLALAAATAPEAPDRPLDCANWIYAGSKSSRCFSEAFLRLLADPDRGPGLPVRTSFVPVRLADDRDVFAHPFALMTGEGSFQLAEEERRNLRTFLEDGGFLLASAGCSSQDWDRSFRREISMVFADAPLVEIPRSDPVFRSWFAVDALPLRKGGEARILGLRIGGRLALVYSPEGLNDTAKIEDCCCCGANEVRDSAALNANIYIHAMLH